MQASYYKEDYDEDFVLAGHSLGAYMSAHYALEYPEKVAKLVLMSPLGLVEKPGTWNIDRIKPEDWMKKRFMYSSAAKVGLLEMSPFSLMRSIGYYGAR